MNFFIGKLFKRLMDALETLTSFITSELVLSSAIVSFTFLSEIDSMDLLVSSFSLGDLFAPISVESMKSNLDVSV